MKTSLSLSVDCPSLDSLFTLVDDLFFFPFGTDKLSIVFIYFLFKLAMSTELLVLDVEIGFIQIYPVTSVWFGL